MHQILCPVDFSGVSAAALRYASVFARSWDARITVVYAEPFSPPPYFTHSQVAELEESFQASRAQAETVLRSFVEKTLGEDSLFNRLFIKYYYDLKKRHGYSELEIAQKREALENVLVPTPNGQQIAGKGLTPALKAFRTGSSVSTSAQTVPALSPAGHRECTCPGRRVAPGGGFPCRSGTGEDYSRYSHLAFRVRLS